MEAKDIQMEATDFVASDKTLVIEEGEDLSKLTVKPDEVTIIVLPYSSKSLEDVEFSTFPNIKKIAFPKTLKLKTMDFYNTKFNYLYSVGSRNYLVNELPINVTEDVDLSALRTICGEYYRDSDMKDANVIIRGENIKQLNNLVDKLRKGKTNIPLNLILAIKEASEQNFKEFVDKAEFKFFNSELKEWTEKLSYLDNYNFYYFAYKLGCFSNEKIRDKYDKETEQTLAQKASVTLANLFKNNIFALSDLNKTFKQKDYKKPNQEIAKLLSAQGTHKPYEIAELIMEYEKKGYKGIFEKVLNNFEVFKMHKKGMEEGNPITYSWERTIQRFYRNKTYENVSEENSDIAYLFGQYGIDIGTFRKAASLRRQAILTQQPHHILEEPLKEKPNGSYTYEMLDKYDANNFLLGIFCTCCASLDECTYGRNVAAVPIVKKDVQNMVVRNAKNDIIAKATMYVNKDKGYALINTFSVNCDYRYKQNDEKRRETIDKMTADILETFKRGIRAFVKTYNKKNPNNHIKTVNVGLGNNKLIHPWLNVPIAEERLKTSYNFEDARKAQATLYKESMFKKIKSKNAKQK